MTKQEKEYLSRVAEIGCLICGSPAQIHHVRSGQGIGQRSNHIGGVIPLCHIHHLNGGFGVAFHAGKKTWQEKHGTEQELIDRVDELLSLK